MSKQPFHVGKCEINIDELTIELLGYRIVQMNNDPDNFSIHLQLISSSLEDQMDSRVELLVFMTLELFSRSLYDGQEFQKINSFFINLAPKFLSQKNVIIEIDYHETHEDVQFFEAYCYDEKNLLIAKGGSALVSPWQ